VQVLCRSLHSEFGDLRDCGDAFRGRYTCELYLLGAQSRYCFADQLFHKDSSGLGSRIGRKIYTRAVLVQLHALIPMFQ
jgi:hypothetical protein